MFLNIELLRLFVFHSTHAHFCVFPIANLNKDSQKEIDIARDIIAHQESLHGSSMYSTKRL